MGGVCSASLDAKRRAINLQASALLNLRAKTEAAIRESNDKHCLFSYSNGWEENPSRGDGSPLSCCIAAKPNAQAAINSNGTGTCRKPHQGLDIWQEAGEVIPSTPFLPHFKCKSKQPAWCFGRWKSHVEQHNISPPTSCISPMKQNQKLSPIVA